MADDGTTTAPPAPRRAAFHAMTEGTREDWQVIAGGAVELAVGLPDRVLNHLRMLGGDDGGFAVDRLEHSLHELDQPAFDPGYDTLPLEHFEPLVRQVMASPQQSIYTR